MRYMGSKARIAKYLLPIILKDREPGQYYIEPFCGGCNMIDKVGNPRIAADANPYLIEMWKGLLAGTDFPKTITREYYNSIRDAYNNQYDSIHNVAEIGWVGFMASYNGRFFDGGYSGHHVVEKTGVRDRITENINNTLSQIPLLQGVEFMERDFNSEYYRHIPPNSIIYCDPPYEGVKKYTYRINHKMFWEWCRTLVKEGHKVFISEYNAPDDFVCIWQMPVTNSYNRMVTTKPIEKLFIHKSQIKEIRKSYL